MNNNIFCHEDLQYPYDISSLNKDPLDFIKHIEGEIKKYNKNKHPKISKKIISFKKDNLLYLKKLIDKIIKLISPV